MRIYPHPTHPGWYVVDIPPKKGQKRERPVFTSYDEAVQYSNALTSTTPETVVHPRIGDVIESYLLWVKENQAEETYIGKERRFRKWITPFFERYRVKDISQVLLDRYAATMPKSCYWTDLKHIRGLIGWMVKRKYADKLTFDPETPKMKYKMKAIPDPADILLFLDAIPNNTHRIMAGLMLYSAMRLHEVRMLKWDNFNGKGFLCLDTKSGEDYLQPIPATLLQWFVDNQKKTGYVFTAYGRNRPVSKITHSLQVAEKKTGVKINAHLFRHSAATFTYERNHDLYEVKELLRHADISQSTIYARYAAHRRTASISNLEEFMNKSE